MKTVNKNQYKVDGIIFHKVDIHEDILVDMEDCSCGCSLGFYINADELARIVEWAKLKE